MRFRVASLAFAGVLASTFAIASATAQTPQAPTAPCSSTIEQQLKDQISTLPKGPGSDIQGFKCEDYQDVTSSVRRYHFGNDSTKQEVGVIFEFKQNGVAVLLGALYNDGTCPAKGCALGLLNNAFLATGYGTLSSKWTSIREDDPYLTVQKTILEFKKAIAKRTP